MKDMKGAIDHLRKHQMYPATKKQLVAECDHLSDFSDDDKMLFSESLPEGTYKSADEVIKALGWDKEAGAYTAM